MQALKNSVILVVLVAAIITTTFLIVGVTYETRQQFADLETIRNEQRSLEEEWGRLLLEESAFSSPSRVERVAKDQLGMILPEAETIRQIEDL